MTADGSSSLLCKTAALLFAGGAHALIFSLSRFDAAPPPLVQPAATRVFILPADVPPPILQEPVVPPPEPELKPEPVPEPEPPPILQQEEAPVDLPEPEPPSQEPEIEPEPPPQEPVPEPILPLPEPVSEPETPTTPAEEPAPALPEPDVVEAPDDSDGVADVPPAPRRPIKPEYPLLARQEQWEGDVVCAVFISKRGTVQEVSVAQSSGYDILDAAALKAVRAARFSPALRRGRPVELRVSLTVSFRLDERR